VDFFHVLDDDEDDGTHNALMRCANSVCYQRQRVGVAIGPVLFGECFTAHSSRLKATGSTRDAFSDRRDECHIA
jgi:hypothetical protein